MKAKFFAAIAAVAFVVGCFSTTEPVPESWRRGVEFGERLEWNYTNGMAWPLDAVSPELVMSSGMEISARTERAEIKIRAGEGLERFYTWDGATRSAKLWQRKLRWYGSLGAYYPGPGEHWKSNGGITRGVLNEGVLWFKSANDALNWLERARSTGVDYVYSTDGLVIGFGKVPERKQVNVSVWQIMIAGERPRTLPGSRDDLLSVMNSPASGRSQ